MILLLIPRVIYNDILFIGLIRIIRFERGKKQEKTTTIIQINKKQ